MDVSATGPAVAAAVPPENGAAITGSVAPAPPEAASSPYAEHSADSHATQSTGWGNHSAIAPAIAKLFNVPAPHEPISLNVSYRVVGDSNTIITVFTDPKTGEEVAQFPPDVLTNLAQFFDQQHGATFDRNA